MIFLNKASVWLSGRIIDEARNTPKAHLYSLFLFPRPVLEPLKRVCPEHFGLSSVACGPELSGFIRPCTNGVSLPRRIASVPPPNKPQTTLSQRAPYIEHLEGWLVRRFWITILNAGLIPPQPASDPNCK